MTQFLPPISATTRVSWRAPSGRLAAVAHELQADRAGAGEGDRRDVAVSGERRARLARAGQQGDRARRHPALAERLDSASAQPGACSAGLRTAVLPVARAAAVIPSGMASGKFQGEMTAVTPRAA